VQSAQISVQVVHIIRWF